MKGGNLCGAVKSHDGIKVKDSINPDGLFVLHMQHSCKGQLALSSSSALELALIRHCSQPFGAINITPVLQKA